MATEYVVRRQGFKHGSEIIPVGEVVPGAASFLTIRELVDGGLLEARYIPDSPSTVQETQEGMQDAGGTELPPAGGEGLETPESVVSSPLPDLAKMTTEQVIDFALENPDRLSDIIAAEEAGRKRKSLLVQLRTLTEGA